MMAKADDSRTATVWLNARITNRKLEKQLIFKLLWQFGINVLRFSGVDTVCKQCFFFDISSERADSIFMAEMRHHMN